MPKNFMIGIGGSGARVAEASLFLCATGYGPDKLNLFLIDPDKGNGNLKKTTELITKYLDCKKIFVSSNSKTKLFKTELVVPKEEMDRVWGIFNSTDTSLSEWLGYNEGLKKTNKAEYDMVSILFSEDELSTPLNEGFRGHPAIGSVVMTELPEDEYPFKLLWDELPETKALDLRLFLVGSVFGGTGAAGFPTLGHRNTLKLNDSAIIERKENESESISRILLGGALILPYFKVIKSGKTSGMYVSSDDFPAATKAALEFYDSKESLGFDQIYFIGDSLSHKVGDFSVGSTSQNNSPHYIEIVSSLASFDYFSQEAIDPIKNKPKFFIAKRENDTINWNSLPISREADNISTKLDEFKAALTTMTVFCFSLVTYGKSILNPEADNKNKMEFKLPWFEHFNNDKENNEFVNLRTSSNKEALGKMIDFAEEFLKWITCACDYSNVELIDKTKIIDDKGNWNDPINNSIIGQLLKEPSNKLDWSGGFLKALNSEEINNDITKNAKTLTAANKFINLFYAGAQKFAETNYTIKKMLPNN